MEQVQEFLRQPLVQSTVTGIVTAAAVDIAAFRSWQSWNDAANYSWSVAAFRWFQGALLGFLTGIGLGAI
jgi:uncharacterized membrane protein